MKKYINIALCAFLSALIGISCNTRAQNSETQLSKKDNETPKVYMFKEISPENLVKIYEALNRKATGKVAVKLSTGEPGGHNFLQPALIKDLVQKVNGTIVECNTAYGGGRADTESHLKAAADHGFTAIAPVDIMDSEGETALLVHGGKHLKENYVGAHYPNYDFTIILSHFKGHAMGGFGGAIKNMSIGIASSTGKAWIHSAGKTKGNPWENLPAQDDFLESMAEAAKAVKLAAKGTAERTAELLQLEQLAEELAARSEELRERTRRTAHFGKGRMLRAYPRLRHGTKQLTLDELRERLKYEHKHSA